MTASVRVPDHLRDELERRAARDGVSVEELVSTALAEKLSDMRAMDTFVMKAKGGDRARFLEILKRDGGEPPSPEDVLS